MNCEKIKKSKFGLLENTDPVALADVLKSGMTVKLLSDLEELRKHEFIKVKCVIKAKA